MAKFVISKETKGTSAKLIKPTPSKYNGLVLMMLTSVTVSYVEAKDASGEWGIFIGKQIPKLNFNFVEVVDEKGAKPGVYSYTRTPVAYNPNSSDKDWWFTQTIQMVKHLIDVYTNEQWNDAYTELLSLELKDEEMTGDEILAAFDKFFKGIATVFNGDEKLKLPCIYKDANGKAKTIWGKLLLYVKVKAINNGNFGFTSYPGEGVIELYVPGVKPSLTINIAKGESILPIANANAAAGIPMAGANGNGKATSELNVGGEDIPSWIK